MEPQVYYQGNSRVPCSVRMNRKPLHSGEVFLCAMNYRVETARIVSNTTMFMPARSYRYEGDGSRSYF